ncbi:MAG: CPBP family intramembrane metalloprotease [Kiritimatiellae bacterium]|nr:CPBP family intramembrane metalloprotease [Kiritimatiellia bacterium]
MFWWWMSGLLVILNGALLAWRPDLRRRLLADFSGGRMKKAGLGIASAAALYAIFLAGRFLLLHFLPASREHISSVYLVRPALPDWCIALLMIFIIGPGEEVFWRAYLQRALISRFGTACGLLAGALLYAGVHAGSGNPVLVLAALTAGLFWGWLYIATDSEFVIISSHVLWDVAVFLVAPF